MKKLTLTMAGVAAMTLAGSAAADVSITLDGFTAAGSQFSMIDGTLSGSIDTAVGDFMLDAEGQNWTWCSDLTVMIANADLSELYMQIGGYSNYGAAHRFTWSQGDSGATGTAGGGTIDIGGIDVSGYHIWIGNGYGSGGDGVWSGQIDLLGSVAVPAPGALALLGLAGLAGRRRRR